VSSTVNVLTGSPHLELLTYDVQRGVMLPVELMQDHVSKMRDSDYNYGDIFAKGQSIVLVEKKDLLSDYQLAFGDYLIIEERQFKILKINDLHAPSVEAIEFMVEELPTEERITFDRETWPC